MKRVIRPLGCPQPPHLSKPCLIFTMFNSCAGFSNQGHDNGRDSSKLPLKTRVVVKRFRNFCEGRYGNKLGWLDVLDESTGEQYNLMVDGRRWPNLDLLPFTVGLTLKVEPGSSWLIARPLVEQPLETRNLAHQRLLNPDSMDGFQYPLTVQTDDDLEPVINDEVEYTKGDKHPSMPTIQELFASFGNECINNGMLVFGYVLIPPDFFDKRSKECNKKRN